MLIAQMTDIHIGFDPQARPEELNRKRLRETLARLIDGPNRPDMLVLSGDLTEHGDRESFERLAELLAPCPFPILPMVGNHDTREELLRAFPGTPSQEEGFVQYAVERDGLRIVLLDTFEPGRHGGAFCQARQAWLARELDGFPETPTLIFMHHPPVVTGIGWMDPAAGEGWMRRFGDAVEGRRQILAIHCGHLHRQLMTGFRGIPLGITPSVAPAVAMDLNPVDPATPDGRELVTSEAPAYALHRWDGNTLVSHYEQIGERHIFASFDEHLQPMIRGMFAERE